MLSQGSASLTVTENSLAKAVGIASPVDTSYVTSVLTVKVVTLPSDGTILLSDGVTPLGVGQVIAVNQLTDLKFRPALNSYSQSGTFTFIVSDPGGATANGTATLVIGAATTPVVATWSVLNVPQNTGPTPIGIPTPVDSSYAATSLSVTVTGLPTNGTVYLSNGTTAVTQGQTLTVAQLTGLVFKSSSTGSGKTSNLAYSVSDPAGKTTTSRAILVVNPVTPPVVASTQLTVAANSPATPIGLAAPVDASFASTALTVTVTGLPTDGKVVLSNGTTQVTSGQTLLISQLTGLEFVPTAGASGQSSSFKYSVSGPSGASATGTATLNIGASGATLVTTAASLTVKENSAATPIGIKAPSDATFTSSQLTAQVTSLPTDGKVMLAGETSSVTVGQTLSIAQLAGLVFKPTQDNTGKTSTFGYSVSDPAGKTAAGAATLVTGPNAIVLENQKPGTPESVWEINPGDDSNLIQGFTTAISTNIGGRVDFKIDNLTNNPNYQINIYRLGYYGGDGATLAGTIQHQASTMVVQPAPLSDPATGLVDAGNWQITDSWQVPTNATSGVYVANVIDGSEVFQIPFVIRDDSSTSDIVFQTDDETWQAYNGWGGNNVYGGSGPGYLGAAYAVSYNRPITTRDGSSGSTGGGEFGTVNDMVFSAEYPAIQWMEENGYDVSYVSGLDVSTSGSLLLNHQVYMDAGHDEYWTDSQRANVQAAADAGVNLVFLSGNEIYWQTRFEPSIDGSASANRTMVTYKDTHADALIDPTGVATGAFMDPRFATAGGMSGNPSNSLTGTVFQVDANRSDSITIPYDMTSLRFWRNTAVANTPVGGTATLVPGVLGYEWDSSPDNGFEPAGLVDLSSTTLQVTTDLLDYGNTIGNGTATHNLVEYRDPVSGALIFGAGTVFWSWGLSADHDALTTPPPVDPNIQQATVNLLADMGVQPSTLQASLVIATQSTDHTPPTSTISQVSATSLAEGQTITVTGTASDVGGVIGGVEVSSDGGTTWHPAAATIGKSTSSWSYSFTTGAPGTYQIKTRAVDDSLNLGTSGAGVSYTVTPSSNLTLFKPTDVPAVITENDAGPLELGVKFVSATSGFITGIRFYKGPENTDTHLGDLWTANGVLLASATFTNETANGWQQVNFATPVQITAGTAYIASYHTNVGDYSDNNFYFDTPDHTNGSLTAPGNGLNGYYAYGSGPLFPNVQTIANATNYWVDVVFNDNSQSPQAKSDSGFSVTENGALSIPASALLANDSDPAGLPFSISSVGNPVNGSIIYNSGTQTVSFTPAAGFAGPAAFTYTITDTSGATGSAQASIAVNYPVNAQSLFATNATPAVADVNDASPVELGVQFTASGNGLISGLRFYKGPTNTGTHTANLWSATGTLLATATFTNETASGWQQVTFSSPVSITAGTTYVASYHTSGNYAGDSNYFATSVTNGELTAGADAGVYAYGSGSIFPSSTYNASNYWVDVIFNGSTVPAPVAVNDSGFTASENGSLSIGTSALLANDSDPNGLSLSVTGVSNPTHGTVSYNADTQTVTFTPTAGYAGAAGFNYTITDGQASATAAVSLNVTPGGPVANADSGLIASENTMLQIAASALLANDTDPNGLALSITGVSASVNGTVSYNADTKIVGFVPAAGYTGPAGFTYSITNANGGIASANVALFVNDPASESLFSLTSVPSTASANDFSPVELGVKFTASSNGEIDGIRFYKGTLNTGTHVADLWTSSGTLLATATFTNETATGWQQVNFSSPVAITAGAAYIASYHGSGGYADNANFFTVPVTSGDLTAAGSGNGVYAYSAGPSFPSSTYNASNYWVDVVYTRSLQPPVANNDSGFSVAENGTLQIAASALLANDTDPNSLALSVSGVSHPSHGTVSFDSASQTVTFVPTANYSGPASFTYSIVDTAGAGASASASLIVNEPSVSTLFSPSYIPALTSVNDPHAVELGVKFTASSNGEIDGIRFYKGTLNTGTHVADLWTSSGTPLATATFTNETATGWQQVDFSTPVQITAGTTYVASYHTNGDYAADPNFFATSLTSGPLTAPSNASSGGNGVYAYGSTSLFPTSTYNANSYAVDVLFKAQLAA